MDSACQQFKYVKYRPLKNSQYDNIPSTSTVWLVTWSKSLVRHMYKWPWHCCWEGLCCSYNGWHSKCCSSAHKPILSPIFMKKREIPSLFRCREDFLILKNHNACIGCIYFIFKFLIMQIPLQRLLGESPGIYKIGAIKRVYCQCSRKC